jgi:hypothetical protein
MIGVLVYLLLQVMKEFKAALREHSKVLTKIEVTLAQQCETLRVLNDAFMVYVKAEKWGLRHNKREERR